MEIIVETRSKTKQFKILALATLYTGFLNLSKSKYRLLIYTVPKLVSESDFNGAVVKVGPRDLAMCLDSRLRDDEILRTLAHEMVHVKQFCRGQLTQHEKRDGSVYFKWMGRISRKSYYDRPWELDAFRNERILANRVYKLIEDEPQ